MCFNIEDTAFKEGRYMKNKIVVIIAFMLTMHILPQSAYAFTPNPQTAYANEFIEKCDNQQWFIDEVERLLNIQEKTLDTIRSKADLDTIVTIGMQGKNINGVIPRAFGELSNLEDIFLANNRLTGNIPPEIFTLSKLENLDLTNNLFSGALSPQIGDLTSLKVLLLWHNDFNGTIPSEIGNLSNLVNLDLAENKFTGQVPDSLGNLGNLQILCLSNNPLNTVIPTTFGNLSSLKVLLMWNAGVKGTIPTELGNATSLQILDIAENKITDGFPASFGQLMNLEKLTARNNLLDADLPQEMGSMASLEILDFPNNSVTGEIPNTFGNLTKLQEFIATNNQLEGELASELGGMTEIVILDLSNNKLTGEIPEEFKTMTKTEQFLLNNNKFEGKIPEIFENMTELQKVYLNDNTFVGDAPQSLSDKQTAGTDVNLNINYLAGAILKSMSNQSDNFIDEQNNLQYKMYIQEFLQLDIDQIGNLYTLFKNYDAKTDKESAKPKLPVERYSFVLVSKDASVVELTQDEFGFYVKPLAEIKRDRPALIDITIIGDEGNPYPTVRVKVVTEKIVTPPPTGGGGGGGGGGSSGSSLPIVMLHTHEGYIQGYEDGTVRPNGNITRAELAMILYRTYDDQAKDASVFRENPFPDVELNDWYGFAISYIKKIGLMQGDPTGDFRPNYSLTRAEFAATIARLKNLEQNPENIFEDCASHWANNYITAVNKFGYMVGYPDNTFKPENNITRAETMTAMNRIFERKPDKADILEKTTNPFTDLDEEHWAYENVLEASLTHEYTITVSAEKETWSKVVE